MLFVCSTNGKGLWSQAKRKVPVLRLELDIFRYLGDPDRGELRAYFDTAVWNTNLLGIIYTDPQWMRDFRRHLSKEFSAAAVKNIGYSEAGMQGDAFVSMDVGDKFIRECDALLRFVNHQAPLNTDIKIEVIND